MQSDMKRETWKREKHEWRQTERNRKRVVVKRKDGTEKLMPQIIIECLIDA